MAQLGNERGSGVCLPEPKSALLDHLQIRCCVTREQSLMAGVRIEWNELRTSIHFVKSGACEIWAEDGSVIRLVAGDVAFLIQPQRRMEFRVPSVSSDLSTVEMGASQSAVVLSGIILSESIGTSSALSLLPPLVHVVGKDQCHSLLSSAMESLLTEALREKPGAIVQINMLLSLIAVEVVRSHLNDHSISSTSWYRGLQDPELGPVLALMLLDPARNWTVESLATTGQMSRSQFARRFRDLLEASPIETLISMRMRAACDLLGAHYTQKETAKRVGYGSVSAFSVAFRRHLGMTPMQYCESLTHLSGSDPIRD
jgi:AraC-like DNA-binding protein